MQIFLTVSFILCAISLLQAGRTAKHQLDDEWNAYKTEYGKKYELLEEVTRRSIWEDSLEYIRQHNNEYDQGKHTYFLGINKYADLTNKEFKKNFLGLKQIPKRSSGSHFISMENIGALPTTVDWRKEGYVTAVKDQLNCGACWAFSATGSLEGQLFKKTGKLISLSEQQLVDCDDRDYGCNGGNPKLAYKYIKKNGIESEKTYHYKAKGGNCKYDSSKVVAKCKGFVNILRKNETDLAVKVSKVGPISVGIDAHDPSFQHYRGGVYNNPDCLPDILDHAVLVVGYGVQDGTKFWLVKNSWGKSWGMSGYIRMSKDFDNQCGIATDAIYPLV